MFTPLLSNRQLNVSRYYHDVATKTVHTARFSYARWWC